MKKFLLMLMLMTTLMCSVALADTYGDWVYNEYNGEVTIERYVGDGDSAVVPDSINDYPVVYIGPSAFKGCTNLTSVHLGSNVTFLGYEAFRDCTALASINFPASLTTIDHCVFINTGFRELILPEGIESIGSYVFENCAQLQTLTLPNSITSMGHGCLQNLPALERLTCPALAIEVESWEYWWNSQNKPTKLYYLNLTASEATGSYEIPGHAFSYLENLHTAILGEGLTKIDSYAFSECTKLYRVELPEGLETINEYAFYSCRNMYLCNFPSTLKSIGKAAFENAPLPYVTLPDGLESIGESAFSHLSKMTYLRVPGSLKTIPNYAFAHASNLETLILCDGIEEIGENSFQNAGRDKYLNLSLPSTLQKMGSQAFVNCGVTSVILPNSLTTMNCCALTSSHEGEKLTIYTTPSLTHIAEDGTWWPPFQYSNTTVWCVKDSAIHNYVKKPHSFSSSRPTIKTYGSSDGVLHLVETETLLLSGSTYTIPLMYANASMSLTFTSNNTAIATVNSDGVITAKSAGTTTITIKGGGQTATFTVKVMLSIDSVTLGFSEITVSAGDVFRVPVSITPASAAAGWLPVSSTSNDEVAAVTGRIVTAKEQGYTTITLSDPFDPDKYVRLSVAVTNNSIQLPASVTTVRREAFEGIKAECITIPASATTIEAGAFSDNTNLKLVRFDGDNITIASDAFDGCGDIFFLCKKNSAAHTYAQQHNITCVFIP